MANWPIQYGPDERAFRCAHDPTSSRQKAAAAARLLLQYGDVTALSSLPATSRINLAAQSCNDPVAIIAGTGDSDLIAVEFVPPHIAKRMAESLRQEATEIGIAAPVRREGTTRNVVDAT